MSVLSLSSSFLGALQRNQSLYAILLLGLTAYSVVRYIRSPYRKLPPGPKGYPIIGNFLNIGEKQWHVFTEWKKVYGDFVYFKALGQPMLVLNSQKAAADLLDRRAANYSDRPPHIVACEILTGGLILGFTRFGDLWRRMRKAGNEGLHKGAVPRYYHKQTIESITLALGMVTEPRLWDRHVRRTSASTTLGIVYDAPPIASEHDPHVRRINEFVGRLTRAALPGAHFVDFFPFMKYIPSRFAKWKREAEEWCVRDSAMFESLLSGVRSRMDKEGGLVSLSATLIKDQARVNLSEHQNAWVAGSVYSAGTETTASTMAWWMLAMATNPDAQKRAQAEIDTVVGRSRLPSFSDFEHLPYTRAMVKEVLRWRPVVPVGSPHRSIKDDWYEGHFIPAGTVCITNVWAINHDTTIYGEDAALYNPSRHLDEHGRLAPSPPDTKEQSHATYGFGRRICLGMHVANNALFMYIAMVVWAMNIEPITDANGKPQELDVYADIDDGLVVKPPPYDYKITPRFPDAAAMLEQAKETMGN